MGTNFSSLAGITCNFSRFMVSNSDAYQALLDFVYRIYSNRSCTPNISHMHAWSLLCGCGYDRKPCMIDLFDFCGRNMAEDELG